MKKTYQTPATAQINITTENMLALSLSVEQNPGTTVDQWSQKKGWSSEDWSGSDEADFDE